MDVNLTKRFGHFLAVVEEGHFGRAARRLGISQPPLTADVYSVSLTTRVSEPRDTEHRRPESPSFSGKKKQKAFVRLSRLCPERRDSGVKSFLVLFFKKELLALLSRQWQARSI